LRWRPPPDIFRPILSIVPALPAPPIRNPILRFWRGRYSLAVSFWLIGLGLYGVGYAAILGLTRLIYREPYDPQVIALAIFGTWAVIVPILFFQAVGVWRAAVRSRRDKLDSHWRWFCARAAQLSVLAVIVLLAVRFGQVGIPQVESAWRMAYEDDPDIAPFSMRIMREGTELEITGGFKYGLTHQARALAMASPDLKVVHLSSGGGRIGEALELVKLIKERGLSTYVGGTCLSACTIAFIAGQERYLKTGGRLGFHRESFAGAESSDLMRKLLLDAGIEEPFVDRVAAQSATGMWYPSPGELEAAHVVTAMVDNHRFAASGLGAAPKPGAFALDLHHNGIFSAFEEIDPFIFESLIEEYMRRYETGQSEGDIHDGLTEMVASRIRRQIAASDNQVLVDYANLLADQYAAIGAKDPRACFIRLTRGATASQEVFFSQELRDREIKLQERALRSSFPRTPVPLELLQDDYAAVFLQLSGRYSQEELAMFGHAEKVKPAQYATYCRLATAIFRGVAALSPMRAGDVMSAIFTNMGAAQPGK
jgi:hypothetical protein